METDDWMIERAVPALTREDDEDGYRPWPGYSRQMTSDAAVEALAECEERWPDLEFRVRRARMEEQLAWQAIQHAQRAVAQK